MRNLLALITCCGVLLTAGTVSADWPELRGRDPAVQAELAPRLRSIRTDHPRIFCTPQEIARIRQRCADDPRVREVWGWIHQWARGDHFYRNLWASPSQLQACVIAYRLTGNAPATDRDPRILEHALAIADYLAGAEGDGWTWPRICKGLAMAYDWLYEDLSPEQRQRYGAAAMRAAKQCYSTWRHSDFNNHLYLEYGPVLYAGIALYEEGIDDEAARQLALDGLDLLVNHMMPAHDIVARGDGGWNESMGYHAFFTYEFAHLIEAWSSATGENLWEDFTGLDGDAHWLVHNARPWDSGRVGMADIGGRDPFATSIAAYMPLLQRRRDDGLAGWWAEQIRAECLRRHDAGQKYLLGDGTWWPYLLWYDPAVPHVTGDDLPLSRHFRGLGWVSMRSSWEPDATFALFVCAPIYLGGHQHCDSNSFVIHKRDLLALDSGVYDSSCDHRGHYYARTIAHNCVTVTDPDEQFAGGTWGSGRPGEGPNDGGQLYGGGPDLVGDVTAGDEHHRAEITLCEQTDRYVAVVGDATRSYSPQKLREFTRAFVYVRPDLFVVFDRVEATNPDFTKRWLLHSAHEPAIDAARAEIVNGEGRLTVQTLLPRHPRITTVGGPGHEFEVEGHNYAPEKEYDADEAGRWRIEVSPSQPAARDYFLHVLQTSDAGSDGWPAAEVTEDDATIATTINLRGEQITVRFPKTGPLTVQTSIE